MHFSTCMGGGKPASERFIGVRFSREAFHRNFQLSRWLNASKLPPRQNQWRKPGSHARRSACIPKTNKQKSWPAPFNSKLNGISSNCCEIEDFMAAWIREIDCVWTAAAADAFLVSVGWFDVCLERSQSQKLNSMKFSICYNTGVGWWWFTGGVKRFSYLRAAVT